MITFSAARPISYARPQKQSKTHFSGDRQNSGKADKPKYEYRSLTFEEVNQRKLDAERKRDACQSRNDPEAKAFDQTVKHWEKVLEGGENVVWPMDYFRVPSRPEATQDDNAHAGTSQGDSPQKTSFWKGLLSKFKH